MKAMILAAGLGSRLKPITNSIPKALVKVGGIPMLDRIIHTLIKQGFTDITVNIHHFADMIKKHIESNDYGIKINMSDESQMLLDTGGGIVKAIPFLFKENNHPVLFHNVDILSDADLAEMMKGIDESETHATLLVSQRESDRKLIFDEDIYLRGWHNTKENKFKPENLQKRATWKEFSFNGIYAMDKNSIGEMKDLMGTGKFSVMDYFLHPKRKYGIRGVVSENLHILDIGKPATLSQAESLLDKMNLAY